MLLRVLISVFIWGIDSSFSKNIIEPVFCAVFLAAPSRRLSCHLLDATKKEKAAFTINSRRKLPLYIIGAVALYFSVQTLFSFIFDMYFR